MKRVSNIYNKIVDIEKIINIYEKSVKRNTKNKYKLERFENNYVSNMNYIFNVLNNKCYIPGKYNIFIIKKPKIRIIMSQNIIDKIINHLVSNYFLVDIYDKTLIDSNIATRRNKGTHYGLRLLNKYLNEVKGQIFYILKFDISKYFFNLDHEILKKIIRKKIKDKDVLMLLDRIIDSTDSSYINNNIKKLKANEIKKILRSKIRDKNKYIEEINNLPIYSVGKGLPIGNMTSQILAIMYLDELDKYIKQKLNIKYYIRYMDDGILIHNSKEYLKYCLNEIEKILSKYKLQLNKKTKIYKCIEGIEFLGFNFIIKNNKIIKKVKNQTKRNFKRRMKSINKLLLNNRYNFKKYIQIRNSYLGHLSYGNCKNLIRKEVNKYSVKINVYYARISNSGEIIKIKDKIQLHNYFNNDLVRYLK